MVEQIFGIESPVEIVNEDRGAAEPLSEEFPPTGFGPTGFGEGKMQTVVDAVQPITCGDDMSEGIAFTERYHFGKTCRAGSKIEQKTASLAIIFCACANSKSWTRAANFYDN